MKQSFACSGPGNQLALCDLALPLGYNLVRSKACGPIYMLYSFWRALDQRIAYRKLFKPGTVTRHINDNYDIIIRI